MPAVEVNYGNDGRLFVGEDKTLRCPQVLRANGTAENIASWPIRFVVRLHDDSPGPPIFDKQALIGGVYAPDPTLNQQRAVVVFTDDELNSIRAGRYRHSWKWMEPGLKTVLAYGDFTPQKATAP